MCHTKERCDLLHYFSSETIHCVKHHHSLCFHKHIIVCSRIRTLRSRSGLWRNSLQTITPNKSKSYWIRYRRLVHLTPICYFCSKLVDKKGQNSDDRDYLTTTPIYSKSSIDIKMRVMNIINEVTETKQRDGEKMKENYDTEMISDFND